MARSQKITLFFLEFYIFFTENKIIHEAFMKICTDINFIHLNFLSKFHTYIFTYFFNTEGLNLQIWPKIWKLDKIWQHKLLFRENGERCRFLTTYRPPINFSRRLKRNIILLSSCIIYRDTGQSAIWVRFGQFSLRCYNDKKVSFM